MIFCRHGLVYDYCFLCGKKGSGVDSRSRKKIKKYSRTVYLDDNDEKVIKLGALTRLPVIFVKNLFALPNYDLSKAIQRCKRKNDYDPPKWLNIGKLDQLIGEWKNSADDSELIFELNTTIEKHKIKIIVPHLSEVKSEDSSKFNKLENHVKSVLSSSVIIQGTEGLKTYRRVLCQFIRKKWTEILSPLRSFGLSFEQKYEIKVQVHLLKQLGVDKIEFIQMHELAQPAVRTNFIMDYGVVFQCFLNEKGKLENTQEIGKIFPEEYIMLLNMAAVIYYSDLVIQIPSDPITIGQERGSIKSNKPNYSSTQIDPIKAKRLPRKRSSNVSRHKKGLKTEIGRKGLAIIDPFRRRLPPGHKPSFTKIVEADQYGINLQGPDFPEIQYTFVNSHFRGSEQEIPKYYYKDYQAIKTFENILNVIGFVISPKMTKSDSLKMDYRIKRLPPGEKIIQLTRKETQMAATKKDLQALNKDIKALAKKMDKLIADAAKAEKPKTAKKTPAKGDKAKTTKKAPAKKAPSKKTAKTTATDQMLAIIKRSKKGVDSAALVKKTGFDLKKVRNILQRTYKQGRIKRVGKGVYVGA